MEKSVKIMWNGKETEIVLKRLSYGDYKKIRQKSMMDKLVNGSIKQVIDLDKYDELMILASIISAPFDIIKSNLDKLSIQDGKLLEKEVDTLNFPKE